MYDSVGQYGQVLSGAYEDWHPPVMARLWALFHLAWDGQAPMFVLQMLLYWLGLGLLAGALARNGARIAAIVTLAIGLWPPFAGWQATVLKDGQMIGAMLAATGLAAWWQLEDRTPPRPAIAAILVLLLYATLLRFNAMFATIPLTLGLLGGPRWFRIVPRGAAILAGCALTVLIVPLVDHHLLAARPSGVERALPTFDLAGISAHAGPEAVPVLPAADWRRAQAKGCVTPLFWDPLADDERCAFIEEGLAKAAPHGALFVAWAGTALHHPIAYLAHRFAHWNMTMRFWVPWHTPFEQPQFESEPNDEGLASPSHRVAPFQEAAGWLGSTPLGSPMLWLVVAITALGFARPSAGPRARLANVLLVSAILLELGFLPVSIASDIRYHLWAILATVLALVLLAGTPLPRRPMRVAGAAVLLVAALCLVARLSLPRIPDPYAAVPALGSGTPV